MVLYSLSKSGDIDDILARMHTELYCMFTHLQFIIVTKIYYHFTIVISA